MATVRKYKPKGYFRGGRVLDDVSIEGDDPAEAGGFPSGILGTEASRGSISDPREPPTEIGFAANPISGGVNETPPDDNPLQRALDAQRRAEELQRSPIAREIDKLPLSEFKKTFLKAHPDLITDEFRSKAMGFHWNAALQAGIADDTPEMNAAILQGVDREIAHVRQQAIENVRMPARSEPEPPPAQRAEPVPAAPAPPLMPQPARRSVPVSAPVSRDAPTYSGRAQSDNTSMTLSPEERDMARRSYTAPDMTDAQKEYAYARNKLRLKRLRQSGEYPDRETN